MQIAVLGAGRMGRAVAAALARAGHAVTLGSRSVRAADAATGALSTVLYADAARRAELVVLTTDGRDCAAAVAAAAPWKGKILLDVTNPERLDGWTLEVGRDTSLGEENAKLAPGAAVVKALNHIWAESIEDPDLAKRRPAGLVCGDDAASKKKVMALLREIGLDPIDVGALASARYTEPFAVLTVNMVSQLGWEPTGMEFSFAARSPGKGDASKG